MANARNSVNPLEGHQRLPQSLELPDFESDIKKDSLVKVEIPPTTLVSDGIISLLAEKFTSVMDGPHDLAPVRSLLNFIRNTPVIWNTPLMHEIVKNIEVKELFSKDEKEPAIPWNMFISYFTNDRKHHILPQHASPFAIPPRDEVYERQVDEVEEVILNTFKACMSSSGQVKSREFFDKLNKNPTINASKNLKIGPLMANVTYLPLTIEENIKLAEEKSPEKMDLKSFIELFKKNQYQEGMQATTGLRPLLSDRSERSLVQARLPYRLDGPQEPCQPTSLKPFLSLSLPPNHPQPDLFAQAGQQTEFSETLFPKEYRNLASQQSLKAKDTPQAPDNVTQFLDEQTAPLLNPDGTKPNTDHLESINMLGISSPRPHPIYPHSDDKPSYLHVTHSTKRLSLENQLRNSVKNNLEATLEVDRKKEAARVKLEKEAAIKKAKEDMYKDLKAKYQERLEKGVHGSKQPKTKTVKPSESHVNNEGEKRRKMQEVLRLQQEGLEEKLNEEQKVLLKEALLLRKMGKI